MATFVRSFVTLVAIAGIAFFGCAKNDAGSSTTRPMSPKSSPVMQPSIGEQTRFGDEIVVCGHLYRIGTPVVTWMDPGGYDAYRTSRHFAPFDDASYVASAKEAATRSTAIAGFGKAMMSVADPDRYGVRYGSITMRATTRAASMPGGVAQFLRENYDDPTTQPLSPDELEAVRNGGWSLPQLQRRVDQFVLHYDVAGISRECFRTLHDVRGLSVHFMLDLDGTIYQTLDLKERAFQASRANDRSVGIEIANIGSYSAAETNAPLQEWYKRDGSGQTYLAVPERLGGEKATRVPGVYRPARNDVIVGQIRGVTQRMYDITPQQYAALIKLTAALGDVLPQIKLDYPRGPEGQVLTRTLTDYEYTHFKGVLGHFHVQDNKSDPGVALQWDYLIENARRLLSERQRSLASK